MAISVEVFMWMCAFVFILNGSLGCVAGMNVILKKNYLHFSLYPYFQQHTMRLANMFQKCVWKPLKKKAVGV